MRVAAVLVLALAGCMTAGAPEDLVDARRACTAYEGQTFTLGASALTFYADDAEYSSYEWLQGDGSVVYGLVQCDVRNGTTRLFADAAESATGRKIDAGRIYWFGSAFSVN